MSDDRSMVTNPADQAATPPPAPQDATGAHQAPADAQTMSPQAQPPAAAQQPQQQPPAAPVSAEDAHHSRIGGMFSSVFHALGGGPEVNYSVTPEGKMVATPAPQRPGDWAKRVIAGALTGLGAGAQVHNTGANSLAGFGAGFGAERAQLTQQDQQKQKIAGEDFNRQQQTLLRKAQTAHLTQETAKVALENTDKGIAVDTKLADMGNQMAQRIASDPLNKDLGVFRSIADVEAKAKTMPDFIENQAHGRVLAVPHYTKDADGKWVSDGFHAAIVTDAWKDRKITADQQVDFFDVGANGEGKWTNHTLKAGTYSNGEAEAIQAAQSKTAAEYYGKANMLDLERREKEASIRMKNLEVLKAKQELDGDTTDDDALVQGMLDGTVDITKVANLRSMRREQLVAKAKQADKTFDMKTFPMRQKMALYMTSGKGGDQIQSFNTLLGHAGELVEITNKYRDERGNSPKWMNMPLNWLQKNMSDPQIAEYLTAVSPVRDEFYTFLLNNHALTESDKKEAMKSFDENWSPAQMEAGVKQAAKTALVRLRSANERWKRSMGGRDFPGGMIEPGSGQALLTIYGDGKPNKYGESTPGAAQTLAKYGMKMPAAPDVVAPPADKLKDGVITKFANGQSWTLENGKPKQVQ